MAWQRVDTMEKVKPMFLRDSPSFPIIPELQPLPSEGIVDKITMSAVEGTFLEIALRDCGIRSFIIAGIALEIGIDPTCRQGSDLGFWPILVGDGCGFGNVEAANHSLASLKHMGDTIVTDVETICRLVDCREVTITSCYASKLVWQQEAKSLLPATKVQNSAALLNRVLCLRATSFAPNSS
jgi:hypothetical protein